MSFACADLKRTTTARRPEPLSLSYLKCTRNLTLRTCLLHCARPSPGWLKP